MKAKVGRSWKVLVINVCVSVWLEAELLPNIYVGRQDPSGWSPLCFSRSNTDRRGRWYDLPRGLSKCLSFFKSQGVVDDSVSSLSWF